MMGKDISFSLKSLIGEIPYQLFQPNDALAVERYKQIKLGIWLYFFLVIFEGALRKWVLPGLATPLLIVRDPIALWLLLAAWQRGLLPSNLYLSTSVVIGLVGIVTATLIGHGSLPVAIYGARTLLFHLPLIFVIASIFTKDDVERIGKVTLFLAIPMALLIFLQFYSPQSAWVNRGVGGDSAGSGFSGAMGYFRPSGTFSFTNGNTSFFSFAACFVFYFWLNPQGIKKYILIGATFALLLAIPLSISRSLFFQVAICMIFAIAASLSKPEFLKKIIPAFLGGAVILVILSQISAFQTAISAFTQRFELANENEGGVEGVLVDRFLGGMVRALSETSDQPFFGYGLGMGSNVGSMLLTGEKKFLLPEGEWGRIIGELGPLMGLLVIFIRIGLGIQVAIASYKGMRQGNLLPWMLLCFGLIVLTQGQWGQPTSLGFFTLLGGLMIASLKDNKAASY
jgi:hypothetical protein